MSLELRNQSLDSLLHALGDRTPVPGGGAAAGITASIGIAAARMVLAYSVDRPELSEWATEHQATMSTLDQARASALSLADQDAEAFKALSALWSLPKDDPARAPHWNDAVEAAIAAPMRTIELAKDILNALLPLPDQTNPMLSSDLAVAAILLRAAALAAAWNVRINLPHLESDDQRDKTLQMLDDALNECHAAAASIEKTIAAASI